MSAPSTRQRAARTPRGSASEHAPGHLGAPWLWQPGGAGGPRPAGTVASHSTRVAVTLAAARPSPGGRPGAPTGAAAPHLALQLPGADVVLALLSRQQVLAAEQRQAPRPRLAAAVGEQVGARMQFPHHAAPQRRRGVRTHRHLHGRRHPARPAPPPSPVVLSGARTMAPGGLERRLGSSQRRPWRPTHAPQPRRVEEAGLPRAHGLRGVVCACAQRSRRRGGSRLRFLGPV